MTGNRNFSTENGNGARDGTGTRDGIFSTGAGFHPLLYYVVLPVTLLFAAVAWSPPFFHSSILEWHESWQRMLFSRVCHQQLDRTFAVQGIPLAVCSRCIGIYSVLPVALVIFSFFSTVLNIAKSYIVTLFVLASLIVIVDGAANLFQLWQSSDLIRVLTGVFWGLATALLLVIALTTHRVS